MNRKKEPTASTVRRVIPVNAWNWWKEEEGIERKLFQFTFQLKSDEYDADVGMRIEVKP